MADLGEFGRARADVVEEPDTFRFHGEKFEIPPAISAVVLMDFVADTKGCQDGREDALARQEKARAALARAGSDAARHVAQADLDAADAALISASNDLMLAMRSYVRGCLPDDAEWRRFNACCRANGVDIDELMDVCAAIFSAVAARPTRRPSGSSDGPSSTGDGSTAGAVSQGQIAGLPVPATDSPIVGEVVAVDRPLSANESARQELQALMVPVGQLLASPPSGV